MYKLHEEKNEHETSSMDKIHIQKVPWEISISREEKSMYVFQAAKKQHATSSKNKTSTHQVLTNRNQHATSSMNKVSFTRKIINVYSSSIVNVSFTKRKINMQQASRTKISTQLVLQTKICTQQVLRKKFCTQQFTWIKTRFKRIKINLHVSRREKLICNKFH